VGAKGPVKLNPRHLVVREASDGVIGPPCTGITTQLLRGEEGLLHLCAAQEPKHGLKHPKPVISLEKLSYQGDERRVSGHEVAVGGRL
jgi:hypothetical protein